jgi:hypothetical protein
MELLNIDKGAFRSKAQNGAGPDPNSLVLKSPAHWNHGCPNICGVIMSDLTKVTIDHDEIRRWVEARRGVPAHVKGTGGDSDDPGLLRIDFPDGPEKNLEPISWDEWFKKFDEKQLAFIYEEKTADGKLSYFNKLVSRETVKDQLEAKQASSSEKKSSSGKEGQPAGHH